MLHNLKSWFRLRGCLFGRHPWQTEGPVFWSGGLLRQEYECPVCLSMKTETVATKWSNDS